MHRNLCILACFFLSGAWYAGSHRALHSLPPLAFWAAGGGAAWLVSRLPSRAQRGSGGRGQPGLRLALAACLTMSLAAGYLRYSAWERACQGGTSQFHGESMRARGTVVDAPVSTGNSIRFKVSVCQAAGDGAGPREVRGLVLVRVTCGDGEAPPRIRYGDSIKIRGVCRKPKPATNPGGFDRAAWLATQGIKMEMLSDAGGVEVIPGRRGNPLVRAALCLRERLEKAADDSLPPDQAALLKGIVLGSKSSLPEGVEKDFRHAGVFHILSVSGLHVGFIFGSIMSLLKRAGVPRRNATIAGILALPAYALLTGLKPPVMRATIMAVPAHLGPYVQRRADSPTSLALASVLVVAMWPGSLFDPGFHLSFGATCGIISISPRVEAALAFLPPVVRGPIAMTVAAQAAILPVVMRQFQEVSIASLVANPVVVPVVGYSTTLGSAAMLLGSICPVAGLFANMPNRLMLRFVLAATSLMVRAPGSYFDVRPPSIPESLAYYAVLWLVCRAYPPARLADRRARARVAAVVLFATLSVMLLHASGGYCSSLRVVFVDVGQGDAALVMTPCGETLLVDAGPPGRNGRDSAGKAAIIPCLRWFGVRSLDRVLLTHLHDDHYGGLLDILEAFPYGVVLVRRGSKEVASRAVSRGGRPAGTPTTGTGATDIAADSALVALASGSWMVEEVSAGYSWDSGGVKFEVLHPQSGVEGETDENGENDRSIVLMITFGRVRILLTGDAGTAVEELLIRKAEEGAAWPGEAAGAARPTGLEAAVLKVGHHGSNLSSCPAFLAAVRPEVCVVSCGFNSHGLPDRRAVARLHAACPKVLRTDERGAVIVTTDGRDIAVRYMIEE